MKDDTQQPGQKKHKDIARIDQETKRTHGWYVCVRFEEMQLANFYTLVSEFCCGEMGHL